MTLVHKQSTPEASNRCSKHSLVSIIIVITSECFELPINKGSKSGLSKAEQVERYLRKAEAQVYVVGTRDPTMFLQETYIGSLRYTFQVRFIFDAEYAAKHSHRYQSPLFELLIKMKVQKAGFQNQEDGALLEKGGNASVRGWYTRSYNVSARNIHRKPKLYFPSSFHIRCRVRCEAFSSLSKSAF